MDEFKKKYTILVNEFAGEVSLLKELTHLLYIFNLHNLQSTAEGDLFYRTIWHAAILAIARLVDESRDSISIVLLLKENYDKYKDNISNLEKNLLMKMGFELKHNDISSLSILLEKSSFVFKIKKMRNKLGIAHFDKAITINNKKWQTLYDENKISIDEMRIFVAVLANAVECLSQRSDNCFWLSHPDISRVNKLIERFK